MAGFNKVIIMGNMTRDPEKIEVNGKAITNGRLALNKAWVNDKGDKMENTTYVDIKAFGKNAENIAKYFSKGKPILVEGHLNVDEWNDKNTNEKRSKMYVIVETFQFVSSAPQAQNAQSKTSVPASSSKVATRPAPAVVTEEYDPETIPF